jgi:pimeloyl-ACP methyl ester carboxylesterase
MEKGLNFRTKASQEEYFKAYDKSLSLWTIPLAEKYIDTSYGRTHLIICGNTNSKPLVLLHAASCGATIWYKNVESLSKKYCIYAIDLITESSKSILTRKISNPNENADWLNEVFDKLPFDKFHLCGLSIGGWTAANYASVYPNKVEKLILLSPIQNIAKMYNAFFFKIIKMGIKPTRKNIENYIGWGGSKEAPLPDSIIEQFTISIMNINSNAAFPKWIKKEKLKNLDMPVMVLFGKNEFAFSVEKAVKRAKKTITNLKVKVLENVSHLLPVSAPELVNKEVLLFLENGCN